MSPAFPGHAPCRLAGTALVFLLLGIPPAASQGQAEPTMPTAATSSSQTLTSLDQVPDGLAPSDWQNIRAAYEAGRSLAHQAYFKSSNTGEDDQFGHSVSVSGDTVVVGAPWEDSSTTGVNSTPNESALDSGAAYVFVRSGTSWTQQAYLKASNTGGMTDSVIRCRCRATRWWSGRMARTATPPV